ncbi:MAG: T9SS type A sorting domain-containing protein, partial [Bacteroidota bacterium]
TTWTNNNTYILDGYVFLEAGGVLNIEPGTRIEGRANPTNGVDGTSALIIARGAQINAAGTADAPIVFTAEGEDGSFDALDDRGSWGGLLILGNAVIGEDGGEENIEGIPEEDRTTYGGSDNEESSGVLRYVSIRYGGAVLSGDNEINGLTLGGVGSGTTIDFVEIFGNQDDGIEIFGGAVDIKHAVVAFCGDEMYDTDESWAGRGQYWFGIQAENDPSGNQQFGGEHDGSEADNLEPKTVHTIYNATFIGMGAGTGNAAGNTALRIRNDVGISYNNSIFTDFGDRAIRFQSPSTERYLTGDFALESNLWFGYGEGSAITDIIRVDDGGTQADVIAKLVAEGNSLDDPMLAGISRIADGGLDPRPNAGSPALSGAATPADSWFDETNYRGAFSFSNNWALGWTHMDEQGYFGDLNETGTIVITDADLVGDTDYNWTNDNVYILDGYVFLEAGSCLNIEAGTRIEGASNPTNGVDGTSALIITRGAQIKAVGTEQAPIIFTAEGEDGSFDPLDDRGSWGGILILGNAVIGEDGGEENIEGIPEEDRTTYGGSDNGESSGIMRFVSIRYGGAVLSGDNEINGLTLGGVGSGTEIDFVEVFGNQDDGIEIFGGAVDIKHAVVAFCGDEMYDTDESWAGRGQFWFGIQAENDPSGNQQFGGEHDGSEADDLEPKTVHTIYNATFIGMGAGTGNAAGNTALRIRNDVGISYNNSIFTDFGDRAIRFQSPSTERYLNDDFKLESNLWFGYGEGSAITDIIRVDDGGTQADVIAKLVAEGNSLDDPILAGISRIADGGLDPRPNVGSPALSGAADATDEWFESTSYRGAFDFLNNWALNWTHMDEQGYFGDLTDEAGVEFITDADLVADTEYNWTPDNVYVLDGYVYLEAGGCLNIAPGTRVEFTPDPTNGVDGTSALIITRDAQIKAEGTATDPIVFTAEGEDGTFSATDDRGSWGGLLILGNAVIGEDGGEENIEGIPEEDRTTYGGNDNADNSGILRYVSIRYGGAVLSGDNEINGLTLGGVGSGTEIDFVEVFGNADDGIEIFGGAVDITHGIVAFCGDEMFDTDESWAGRGQFWFGIQAENDPSGNQQFGGEHDGSEADDLEPRTVHTIYNATYFGMGDGTGNAAGNTALRIRNDVGISYNNSIFADFGEQAIRFQSPSTERYLNGDFALESNIWSLFGDGETLEDIIRVDDGGTQAEVIAKLASEGNQLVPDAEFGDIINSISREPIGLLDPRPNQPSLAFENVATPSDAFFETVDYRGAFDNVDNWAIGWSHMDELGYFGDLVETVELGSNDQGLALNAIAPNPVNNVAQLAFNLPTTSDVIVYVYTMEGKAVVIEKLGRLTEGANNYTLDTTGLASGQYIVAVMTNAGGVSQKMTVVK